MTVRAKFQVVAIRRTVYGVWNGKESAPTEVQTIEMQPVISGSDENKAFFASTPSGKIELGTVNKDAAAQFELMGEYYVDFTPAEPAK